MGGRAYPRRLGQSEGARGMALSDSARFTTGTSTWQLSRVAASRGVCTCFSAFCSGAQPMLAQPTTHTHTRACTPTSSHYLQHVRPWNTPVAGHADAARERYCQKGGYMVANQHAGWMGCVVARGLACSRTYVLPMIHVCIDGCAAAPLRAAVHAWRIRRAGLLTSRALRTASL